MSVDGDEICVVCGDKSGGNHYGAIVCQGCKGFFKRANCTAVKDSRCYLGGECPISMTTRNNCRACRFKKCLQMGMVYTEKKPTKRKSSPENSEPISKRKADSVPAVPSAVSRAVDEPRPLPYLKSYSPVCTESTKLETNLSRAEFLNDTPPMSVEDTLNLVDANLVTSTNFLPRDDASVTSLGPVNHTSLLRPILRTKPLTVEPGFEHCLIPSIEMSPVEPQAVCPVELAPVESIENPAIQSTDPVITQSTALSFTESESSCNRSIELSPTQQQFSRPDPKADLSIELGLVSSNETTNFDHNDVPRHEGEMDLRIDANYTEDKMDFQSDNQDKVIKSTDTENDVQKLNKYKLVNTILYERLLAKKNKNTLNNLVQKFNNGIQEEKDSKSSFSSPSLSSESENDEKSSWHVTPSKGGNNALNRERDLCNGRKTSRDLSSFIFTDAVLDWLSDMLVEGHTPRYYLKIRDPNDDQQETLEEGQDKEVCLPGNEETALDLSLDSTLLKLKFSFTNLYGQMFDRVIGYHQIMTSGAEMKEIMYDGIMEQKEFMAYFWKLVKSVLAADVISISEFCRNLPGMRSLNIDDLSRLCRECYHGVYMITTMSQQFLSGQISVVLDIDKGLVVGNTMWKYNIGTQLTNECINLCNRMVELDLTMEERTMMAALEITSPLVPGIKDKERLAKLHRGYRYLFKYTMRHRDGKERRKIGVLLNDIIDFNINRYSNTVNELLFTSV